jgi:hypothetical protein
MMVVPCSLIRALEGPGNFDQNESSLVRELTEEQATSQVVRFRSASQSSWHPVWK